MKTSARHFFLILVCVKTKILLQCLHRRGNNVNFFNKIKKYFQIDTEMSCLFCLKGTDNAQPIKCTWSVIICEDRFFIVSSSSSLYHHIITGWFVYIHARCSDKDLMYTLWREHNSMRWRMRKEKRLMNHSIYSQVSKF